MFNHLSFTRVDRHAAGLACALACIAPLTISPATIYAAITTTGDAYPEYTGYPTWPYGATLVIGQTGTGAILVDLGSDVNNTGGTTIGESAGSHGTVIITGTGSNWYNSKIMHVGVSGEGVLRIEDGAGATSMKGRVANAVGSTGSVHVTGAGSTWTMDDALYIGYKGHGSIHIGSGGAVSSKVGWLGQYVESIGIATITGPDSSWINSGNLSIGWAGTGTLNIEQGGTTSSYNGYVGIGSESDGTVNIDGIGSSWDITYELLAGNYGAGTVNILNGGVVNNEVGQIASSVGSNGTVNVSGDSEWNNSDLLRVGQRGDGVLNISNGGTVNSALGILAYYEGSKGTVTVSGADSAWNVSGNLYVGYNDTGQLHIENDAEVNVGDYTWITRDNPRNTEVHFNHGTLNTAGLMASASALKGVGQIYTNGLVSDIDLVFDSTAGPKQTVILNTQPDQDIAIHLDTSDPENSGPIGAGYQASGTLTIKDGVHVTSKEAYLGYWGGANGTATVTGAGTTWDNIGELIIGRSGTGTLDIESGATVTSASVSLGNASGSNGTATVDGTGSSLSTTGYLSVGGSGDGTLNVRNAAAVTNNYKLIIGSYGTGHVEVSQGGILDSMDATIGRTSYTSGTASVSGIGSIWNIADRLYVGEYGQGELSISGGGVINTKRATIAYDEDAIGAVMIRDTGSVWNITESLAVGYYGNAKLYIENGGTVNDAIGSINGISEVNVVGPGSTWNNSDKLSVVSGTLRILDGGTVNSTYGYIQNSGGAVVSGDGSTWNTTSRLYVASRFDASLLIESGGTVNSSSGIIGSYSHSDGMATVTGPGSVWNCNYELIVGQSDSGILNINNDATVYVGRRVIIGSDQAAEGVINLAGGMLELKGGTLSSGDGIAHFNFTAGSLKNAAKIDLKQPFIQQGGTLEVGGWTEPVVGGGGGEDGGPSGQYDDVGLTEVIGDYRLVGGAIDFELGGDEYAHDLMTVSGDIDIALLGTTLDLQAVGPIPAGTYTIIESSSGTVTGMFEHVTGIGMYPGLVDVLYGTNTITVTLNWDFVPGDLNGDGLVDIKDLNNVLDAWNQNITPGDLLSGDPSGDGFVGIEDLNVVLSNWNAAMPPPTDILAVVPEPGTVGLLAAGAMWCCGRRWQHRAA